MLDRLSFGSATLGDSIFGLVMCIIGFLVVGVFVLHQNQLRYVFPFSGPVPLSVLSMIIYDTDAFSNMIFL